MPFAEERLDNERGATPDIVCHVREQLLNKGVERHTYDPGMGLDCIVTNA
jgi:hypothetical protein